METCADNYFVSLLNDKIDEVNKSYINKPKDEITWGCFGSSYIICPGESIYDRAFNTEVCKCDNVESIIKRSKKELSEYKVLLAELKDMTLQEKLIGFPSPWISYESEFSYCASSMKKDEVTFKAKWK